MFIKNICQFRSILLEKFHSVYLLVKIVNLDDIDWAVLSLDSSLLLDFKEACNGEIRLRDERLDLKLL